MELMHIDKSYLSRLLQKLENEQVITRRRSDTDARSVAIALTQKGLEEFDKLNRSSDEQIKGLIMPLTEHQAQGLIADMQSSNSALGKGRKIALDDITIRTTLQSGDLGYVAYLHGKIYMVVFGFGFFFVGFVLVCLGVFVFLFV